MQETQFRHDGNGHAPFQQPETLSQPFVPFGVDVGSTVIKETFAIDPAIAPLGSWPETGEDTLVPMDGNDHDPSVYSLN